ncbi:MAG TPA: hypothetical protein DCF33_11970 [Saprospirales bacterium]|nr:hypothetical protein [Saprospirales bacterium]
MGVSSCGQNPPPESRTDKLAKSLCQCTSELLVLNQKAQSSPDSLAFQQIEQAFNKAKACSQALGIKKEEQPVLETSLQSFCPDLMQYPELIQELTSQ